jgi:hypothetical protein
LNAPSSRFRNPHVERTAAKELCSHGEIFY